MIPKLRHIDSWDNLIYVFILLLAGIVFQRVFYPRRFSDYIRLIYNDKYMLLYKKKERLIHPFSLVGMISHWLVISIFLLLWSEHLSISTTFLTPYPFLNISLIVVLLYSIKLFTQKILISIFDLESFGYKYLYKRVGYNNYSALILGILLLFIIYTFKNNYYSLIIASAIYLVGYLIGLYKIIKTLQKRIIPYFFYFILYLCTLEIAPCVVLFHLIIKMHT